MKEKRNCPCWYWQKGLHDAEVLEASMQDDTLVLRIDSRNAMYDNFVEQIVFLDARLRCLRRRKSSRSTGYGTS